MNSPAQLPVIGYTLGDQAGVGPEVLRKALLELQGSPARFVPMGPVVSCTPGVPNADTAKAAWEQLETAADALREGKIDAVVTAPVCKENLQKVGFPFPGQTEFFADRLHVKKFAMCLTGKRLTVGLCTIHVALEQVPRLLGSEMIQQVGCLLCEFLLHLDKSQPRLAVAALNPHSGEGGAFGSQEQTIITPAVLSLRKLLGSRASVDGPCVPDSVYRDAANGLYDAVIAPYHDQALIPLKLLDFNCAVNVTLGLPRPRFSPDHGTAFNIAGKNMADAGSTLQAFRLALRYLSHEGQSV